MAIEIKELEMERPINRRGQKSKMQERLKALTPNSKACLGGFKENQISAVYAAAKLAELSVSVHRTADGNYAVWSNGPRNSR